MDVKIRFYFHGIFFSKNQNLLYRKGSVYVSEFVDSDELSRFELERLLEDGTGVVGVEELWYLDGGLCFNDGLRRIYTDSDITAMVSSIKDDRVAHVYFLLGGDVSPSLLLSTGCDGRDGLRRSPRKRALTNNTDVVNQSVEGNGSVISISHSTPKNTVVQIVGGDEVELKKGEGELDGDEYCSQTSDSLGDDVKFHDSGDEDEDLFGEFENGDMTNGRELTEVAEVDLAFNEDVTHMQLPESDIAEESDGLRSPDGSDDDGGARRRYPEFNHHTGFKSPIKLEVGMVFASSAIFRKAISQYSVERGGDFNFLHNDSKRVNVQCKKKCDCEWRHCRRACGARNCGTLRCSFRASARRMSEDGSFQLKSLNGVHSCGRQHLNSRVTSKFLAEMYIEHYRDDPRLKLSAFINTVLRDINVKITHSQAVRTRMRACLMLQGDAREQYAHICDYAETLLAWKVASAAYVSCHGPIEKPIFQRFYVCLDACKNGFLQGCRPIIGFDGCHLKGAYTGQILSVVAKDGNENIFLVAYAVVESECKDSWCWFMENFFQDIGNVNLCIMSDRQKDLLEAVKEKAPMAEQRYCVRHLYGNFKNKYGTGKNLKDALWEAARATKKSDFDDAMKKIRHFTKSDMLLNNMCESWNKFILEARDKPILTCCEWIRRSLMCRFVKKKEGMMKYNGKLTPKAAKRLETFKNIGQEKCSLWCGGSNRFEVELNSKIYMVDMNRKSCSCNKWGLSGIPCPHACVVILSTRGMELEDFVNRFYTKDMYLRAYGEFIGWITRQRN